MAELVVKTKLNTREVKKRFADLPRIISGEKADPLGLRRFFFAVFARRLYELIHEAYRLKSMGASDSLGNNWRALKPKTIKNRTRASFISKYPLSAQLLINRVSDRLFNSLAPGRVAGQDYLPTKDQTFILSSKELILGSNVEYSNRVNKLRRLWPARMKAWFQDAVSLALDRTLIRLAKSL